MYQKIKTIDQIFQTLNRNQKIVLVTGVFDLLHKAHINFLKKAKSKGDILLVGLEQDERVSKIKGKDRPIQSLQKRLEQVASLNFVDFAFPLPLKFDSPRDHKSLITKIKPDILAVSQNTPNLIQKKEIMSKVNGKLEIVMELDPSISTTQILTNPIIK